MLGAAWRENLALPDRAIGTSQEHTRKVVELIRRRAASRDRRSRIGRTAIPDHLASAALLREAVFNAKLKRYSRRR